MISWNVRCTAVALLLAGTALLLQARATNQFVPPRTSLASFPVELRSWVGTDIAIPDATLKSLGPGEYVQRIYQDQMTTEPYVTLYLAYLPNQHALFRHLPQDCLAGSGWSTVESGTTTLALPGDAPFPANRYLITRGSDRQLVLFWYSAHGRLIANENWVDFYLVFDSLRWNRSDNALIRMDTELRPGEKPDQAKRRLLAFADLVNPLLKNYIPR